MSKVPYMEPQDTFSSRLAGEIRAEMARQGIKQSRLVDITGSSPANISRKLRGTSVFTTVELALIASALGTTGSDLLARAEATAAA